MKRKFYLTALAALSATAIGTAYAAKAIENDALAIETAKISLTQAVTVAEQQIGGKASRAEYEKHKGQWIFDVEVVNGKKVMDVKVDPMSGKVIAATEDKADHDDDHDQAD
ncbi:propeptide PepSY and peptidase M4 [Sulfuricella denitrificans skB26]|uniref:Propeptide PepSY and peptidase M4 n=1 Tax=Sulfuricella denitrificans (strain DSM 22764 / NBRC 105220 / skB26) TaxID=1163617 RepID=S6B223_SULDS|nr:PepSY domain-containing protein [Sulfuricella denitrificans]BAN34707.1 propeptide PepSY and peptidase M4 [Sulfuricella denitrificans skB26]